MASMDIDVVSIKFFGVDLPSWGWEDKGLRELFAGIHSVLAVIFMIAICVHVFAALKHMFVDRDKVLQRMLP
ncbi:MAG: cytochrome b [Noviherbaspirillum sp.]